MRAHRLSKAVFKAKQKWDGLRFPFQRCGSSEVMVGLLQEERGVKRRPGPLLALGVRPSRQVENSNVPHSSLGGARMS